MSDLPEAETLALDVTRHSKAVRGAGAGIGEEVLEVVAHHAVEHRLLRPSPLVSSRAGLRHGAWTEHVPIQARRSWLRAVGRGATVRPSDIVRIPDAAVRPTGQGRGRAPGLLGGRRGSWSA